MSVKHLVLCAAVLAQGCWVDFADDRLEDDGGLRRDSRPRDAARSDAVIPDAMRADTARDQASADTLRVDRGVSDTVRDAPEPDADPADATPDQERVCEPNAFVRCDGRRSVTCNADGTATESVLCAHGCSTVLGRCRECNPDTYEPWCQPEGDGSWTAGSCGPEGTLESTPCADTCVGGICCADADGDDQSTCEGDCDDDDDRVFSGQTVYFTVERRSGGFDFNCDGEEELQFKDQHDCPKTCPDRGWIVSPPPNCGISGNVVRCARSSSNGPCNLMLEAERTTQACR